MLHGAAGPPLRTGRTCDLSSRLVAEFFTGLQRGGAEFARSGTDFEAESPSPSAEHISPKCVLRGFSEITASAATDAEAGSTAVTASEAGAGRADDTTDTLGTEARSLASCREFGEGAQARASWAQVCRAAAQTCRVHTGSDPNDVDAYRGPADEGHEGWGPQEEEQEGQEGQVG